MPRLGLGAVWVGMGVRSPLSDGSQTIVGQQSGLSAIP